MAAATCGRATTESGWLPANALARRSILCASEGTSSLEIKSTVPATAFAREPSRHVMAFDDKLSRSVTSVRRMGSLFGRGGATMTRARRYLWLAPVLPIIVQ